MILLFQKQYEDDSFELLPLIVSKHDWKINNYLQDLLKESISYDKELENYVNKCKDIIRVYLNNNYDAITGWRGGSEASRAVTNQDKDGVIDFLCSNYSYCQGESIVGDSKNFSMIGNYCDIKKLRKPYPKLPEYPKPPKPYYKKEWFYIKEAKCLDDYDDYKYA